MDNAQLKTEQIEKTQERIVLAVASVYTIAMFLTGWFNDWQIYDIRILPLFIIAGWVIHCRNMWNYFRRVQYVTAVCWIEFIFYAMETKVFPTVLLVMVCLIVLLSIYNLNCALYPGLVIPPFIFFYHGFIEKTIWFESVRDYAQFAAQFISVYIIILVGWLIQRNREAKKELLFDKIRDLEIAERSKSDFLVNVSHNIRTPINTVCGMSEAILQGKLSSELQRDMEDIWAAGRNLLSMISNILDFSELDIGKLNLVEENYNITSTITDIVNTALTMDSSKRLELIVDCDADLPSGLLGDEQKIRRIIVNLISNAIKFTQEGGVILRIKGRREEYGINLTVSVRDSGIGVEQADLEKVFMSFSRVDTKRTTQESGVGLGLAIALALVRSMGGFITVDSTPKVGSEFRFTIPQKILDEMPVISISDKKDICAAFYINLNKYGYTVVREGYESCIRHIAEQLDIPFRFYKNLSEFKQYVEQDNYSHIFIGWEEYCEDRIFFEELSTRRTVVLFLDYDQEFKAAGQMLCINKPITIFSVAAVFNGQKRHVDRDIQIGIQQKFIAPQAHVLVVDDNTMNLKVMKRLLRPYRMKVTVASSGTEALEKLNTPEFDCVFLDHMMPEMDGVEVVHRIRQNFGIYYQSLPVIAFTANAIGGAREMFVSEGFNDFIAKPIELSVLDRILHRYLPPQLQIMAEEEHAGAGTDAHTIQAPTEKNPTAEMAFFPAQAETARGLRGLTKAGINLENAYFYCGDEEGFREIITIFHEDGNERKEDLARYFAQHDWKNYVICVHSLKGAAKSIGADALSAAAKELEYAGKDGRFDFIQDRHEAMLAQYKALLDVLARNTFLYPDQADRPAQESAVPAGESCEALLAQIGEKISNFESAGLSQLLDRLVLSQTADDSMKEDAEKLRSMAADFDFLGAAEVLERMRADI